MAKEKPLDKITDVMTPVGTSVFVKINGVIDDFAGGRKYTVTMHLDDADAEALKEKLVKIWESSNTCKQREENGKETDRPTFTLTKKKDYGWQLKASTQVEFTDKDGNTHENVVRLVDGDKKPMDEKTAIWNGSKIALWIGVRPYETAMMYGVSLKLKGIQVIDLVTGGAGGAFGGAASDDVGSYGSSMSDTFDTSEDIPF